MLKSKFTKSLSYILYFIIILFFILLTTLVLNSKIRKNIYYNLIGGYNLYNYLAIKGDIKQRDFESASKKILNYIKFSQKISKGKNRSLQGIYNITELASSRTYFQEEFNQMEKVYLEINKITDDIYMNHVWLARSLADNDYEKSLYHLNKALELNKSNEDIYREIIRIYLDLNNNSKLINKYCTDYFVELEGSKNNSYYKNYFNSNFTFSIIINDKTKKSYLKNLINLNSYNTYNFNFSDLKNIKNFSIIHNFFPGSKLAIKNIYIINKNQNFIKFDSIDLHSEASYILEQFENEIIFITTEQSDHVIKFYLNKSFENVESIKFDLKLIKLPLANKSICPN